MKFALKIGSFFFFFAKEYEVIKRKIKGIIEDLKIFFLIKKKKERKNDRKNSKNISTTFSGFV